MYWPTVWVTGESHHGSLQSNPQQRHWSNISRIYYLKCINVWAVLAWVILVNTNSWYFWYVQNCVEFFIIYNIVLVNHPIRETFFKPDFFYFVSCFDLLWQCKCTVWLTKWMSVLGNWVCKHKTTAADCHIVVKWKSWIHGSVNLYTPIHQSPLPQILNIQGK